MRVGLGLAAVSFVPAVAAAAVTETETEPYPGVRHVVRVDDAIPARAHIVEVDLSSAELRLVATEEADRGLETSDWAAAAGVQVAVNGDLFDPITFAPAGLAFGGGASGSAWSLGMDTEAEGFVSFDRSAGQNHARIEPPETIVAAADLGEEIEGVVAGRPMLVRGGAPQVAFDCDDVLALPCERAPRTAVGVSEDGRTLYLVVVDGWQAASLGMTATELAALLAARGAYDALGLDPGASSTLFVAGEGGVVSAPSDGVERAVANHLGVAYGSLPPGSMIGFVRERDVFGGANLVGATVTLDDGQTDVTDAEARYGFTGLTPRFTCATASKAGYHSATQCRVVVSGMMIYNSIALFPNSDFIDAGPGAPDAAPPPDAPPPPPDAGPPADAALAGGDGGDLPDPRGICECRAPAGRRGGAGPGRGAAGLLVVAACLGRRARAMLVPRRGRAQ